MRGRYYLRVKRGEWWYRELPLLPSPLFPIIRGPAWHRIETGQIKSACFVKPVAPFGPYELRIAWVDDQDREAYVPLGSVGTTQKWLRRLAELDIPVETDELPEMRTIVGYFLLGYRIWPGVVALACFVTSMYVVYIKPNRPLNEEGSFAFAFSVCRPP